MPKKAKKLPASTVSKIFYERFPACLNQLRAGHD